MPFDGSANFDFLNPDYTPIFEERLRRLERIRGDNTGELLPRLKAYYKQNPADFIEDWGVTFDPNNVIAGLPATMPFILFPKQREWVDWVVEQWRAGKPGITEKTRQMGFSWLSMALSCTLCIFYDDMSIGVGSQKLELVDQIGNHKTLIQKCRVFMDNLPKEFRAGWTMKANAAHMKITFPETGAIIAGEGGDNMGRGNTCGIYFLDEAAHLERPMLVEAALSQTTRCRMDISTPRGMNNPFAMKRHLGNIKVFTFHWTNDPRKTQAWYDKQCLELDPVIRAQELDIDYAASVEGVLIPQAWVRSAVDAHLMLQVPPTGKRTGALDVADEGRDKNAFCGAHGVVVEVLEEWSGKDSDIFSSVQRAFRLCDEHSYDGFMYDADGLGAGVRGDARIVNEHRAKKLSVLPFRGSGAVEQPDHEDVKERKNIDFFQNAKAQSWWSVRSRFQKTHRAIEELKAELKADGVEYTTATLEQRAAALSRVKFNPDAIIALPSGLNNLAKLMQELSQPTFSESLSGKMVIDKNPDGTRSPNLADALMIRFCRRRRPMVINDAALQRALGRAA